MNELFAHVNQWHWWGLAIILLVFEVFAPGTFFLWPAAAAGVVGLLLLVAPGLTWEFQLIIFAVLSVVSLAAWRIYHKDKPQPTDQPNLNRRGRQYLGRTVTLSEAIVNGHGRVRLDDTMWRVEGPDLPAGTTVKVIGADGVVLKVDVVS